MLLKSSPYQVFRTSDAPAHIEKQNASAPLLKRDMFSVSPIIISRSLFLHRILMILFYQSLGDGSGQRTKEGLILIQNTYKEQIKENFRKENQLKYKWTTWL